RERSSINVRAGIVGDMLIGPHLLPSRLRGHLPRLFEDVPLNTRRQMWFMHDRAPAHFSHHVRYHLNEQYPQRWIG
ncbi:hypothetical protein L798_09942, partial [Zootermopsis nevadensis]